LHQTVCISRVASAQPGCLSHVSKVVHCRQGLRRTGIDIIVAVVGADATSEECLQIMATAGNARAVPEADEETRREGSADFRRAQQIFAVNMLQPLSFTST
jgi:hypothetical protein